MYECIIVSQNPIVESKKSGESDDPSNQTLLDKFKVELF